MSNVQTCQVIIAGAGPVGTTLATFLAQNGVDVVVLEAGGDCAQDMRASTFHPPTLEMLDQIGITPTLIEKGLNAPVYHWRDRKTGEVIDFDLSEIADRTHYPFRIQCEQYHLSRALAEGLEKIPNAEMNFSRKLLSFVEDDDGVTVHAEGPLSIETWRTQWLIGADGANSLVRKWLGTGFDGFTYPEKFLCFSTDTELSDYLPNLAYVNYVSDPEEWLVLLRVPRLWRILLPAGEDTSDDELRSDENKTRVFNRLLGDGVEVKTEHRTIYRIHQRVAQSFLSGRVALIGDAAHLNNPLGGFGMNSGIHDAFNLGEKLLAVLNDGADPSIVQKFDRQRRRVTHDFTQAQTIQNMEMMRGGQGEAHARRQSEMRAIQSDPDRRRAYLLRQSMFESLDQAAAID